MSDHKHGILKTWVWTSPPLHSINFIWFLFIFQLSYVWWEFSFIFSSVKVIFWVYLRYIFNNVWYVFEETLQKKFFHKNNTAEESFYWKFQILFYWKIVSFNSTIRKPILNYIHHLTVIMETKVIPFVVIFIFEIAHCWIFKSILSNESGDWKFQTLFHKCDTLKLGA